MKKTLVLLFVLTVFAMPVLAQSHEVSLTLTDLSCAATVTTSGDVQATAPCTVTLYKLQVAGTVTTCPAFSTSTYTLVTSTLSMAANSIPYTDTSVTQGYGYCYEGTVTWTSGGTGPSAPSATFLTTVPLVPQSLTITGTAS